MPNLKLDVKQKKPEIPKSKDLMAERARFRPPQGKSPIPSTSSFKQGKSE